jgi:hypothetical protein
MKVTNEHAAHGRRSLWDESSTQAGVYYAGVVDGY